MITFDIHNTLHVVVLVSVTLNVLLVLYSRKLFKDNCDLAADLIDALRK